MKRSLSVTAFVLLLLAGLVPASAQSSTPAEPEGTPHTTDGRGPDQPQFSERSVPEGIIVSFGEGNGAITLESINRSSTITEAKVAIGTNQFSQSET